MLTCPTKIRPKVKAMQTLVKDEDGNYRWTDARDVQRTIRKAECGQVVSVNAGVNTTQVADANKMMAVAGVGAHFDAHTGNLVARNRREYLKALHVRGLHNMDEICGGNSRPGE